MEVVRVGYGHFLRPWCKGISGHMWRWEEEGMGMSVGRHKGMSVCLYGQPGVGELSLCKMSGPGMVDRVCGLSGQDGYF